MASPSSAPELLARRSSPVEFPASSISDVVGHRGYFLAKRVIDVVLATSLALLLSPLMLAIALAVHLSSRGPIFFAQDRIGLRGRRFRMLKFRTMHAGVRRYAKSPVSSSDPRLTRVGSWLRRFSVDELPQLWNVVRGEMSMVGPRPEMPYIVRRYSREERRRLEALPGITGLWQISHARACPIHHNLQYDLEYIARRSLALDLIILLRTAIAVVRGIGAA